MPHILIVDDEIQARGSVRRILEDAGHRVSEAASGEEALTWLSHHQPDLVVLDIIMSGLSGVDVCRRLRADPFQASLPIIFLTAKSRAGDIAAGLDAGGDDYITKPVEVLELPARVRALLRRAGSGGLASGADYLTVSDLRLHVTDFKAWVGEREVDLSATEHRLLYTLMLHAGQPLSVERLLQDVWGYPAGVGDPALVYSHIRNLRQKVEPDSSAPPQYLRNIRGRGYFISE